MFGLVKRHRIMKYNIKILSLLRVKNFFFLNPLLLLFYCCKYICLAISFFVQKKKTKRKKNGRCFDPISKVCKTKGIFFLVKIFFQKFCLSCIVVTSNQANLTSLSELFGTETCIASFAFSVLCIEINKKEILKANTAHTYIRKKGNDWT